MNAPAPHAPGAETQAALRHLLGACEKMLKLTGGSQYWTGDTQEALELMEVAVAEAAALRIGDQPETRVPVTGDQSSVVFAPGAVGGLEEFGASVESRPSHLPDLSENRAQTPRLGESSAASPAALPPTLPAVPHVESSAIVPPILASVAASVERGLQMAGVETERWRS